MRDHSRLEAEPSRITGTWLNLFHQDTRNDVTNPASADIRWDRVVADLAAMGITHLILLAVANEGVAAYPSRLRPDGGEPGSTPVDIILTAAEDHAMRVYLSTGWVDDQDDDASSARIRAGQIAIMEELAALYGGSPAFEGWYLPCEDSIAPRFSARTIESVNALADAGRALVPGARTLISPYYPHAAVVDDEYVRMLQRLTVDAVAYQDGVGCAYTSSLAGIYPRLRWAHDQAPGVALWANVESFAWEHGVANVRDDALVAAAFPRLLQQLLDTGGHVDRIVTFIAQSLMQGEDAGLGGPEASRRLRRDYTDHLDGRGRWGASALWRLGRLENAARGCVVTCSVRPVPGLHHEHRLTSGCAAGSLDPLDSAWVRFDQDVSLVVDLGSELPVARVGLSHLHSPALGISQPARVEVEWSTDGTAFDRLPAIEVEPWEYDSLDTWRDVTLLHLDRPARFLRLSAVRSLGWLLIDQVLVTVREPTGP